MRRRLKRLVNIFDNIVDLVTFTACIFVMLIGAYALYDSYMVYNGTNDSSILQYKPGYEGVEDPEKEIKGNMVGWITITDTSVDFPIMQGIDNLEYLNKDPFGEYSLAGSIFLDSRNSSDFSDEYSLVYGHHMAGDMMFGSLDKFAEKEYFDTYKAGTLTVGDLVYDLETFALAEVEATEEKIFAPSEATAEETLEFVAGKADFYDKEIKIDFHNGDKVLALSTCKYPDTADRRVLFCKMTLSEKKISVKIKKFSGGKRK